MFRVKPCHLHQAGAIPSKRRQFTVVIVPAEQPKYANIRAAMVAAVPSLATLIRSALRTQAAGQPIAEAKPAPAGEEAA